MKSANSSSANASSKSAATKSTRPPRSWRAALRRATRSAASETSLAIRRACPILSPAPPQCSQNLRPRRRSLGGSLLLNDANDLFDDQLGLRSRDQDVGRDLEVEAEKFLAAGDILQRLSPAARRSTIARNADRMRTTVD